jgi:AcrR family transcriptional regulator
MSETRQRILDTARELFNERGLHRVGVREIAREARISPGNLSYHFATKDDLVTALLTELHELDARTVFADLPKTFSLADLYQAARGSMRNALGFRFVLLGYADAVRGSPELQKREEALALRRRKRSVTLLELLADNGYLERRAASARADYLHEQGEMISGGWLNAAALRPDLSGDEAAILHYAKLGCALLEPHCTPKGARQMRQILSGALDD